MKDIIIKGDRIKREILKFSIFLFIAIGLNIYSIIRYKTHWSELYSQIHIILLLALFLYAISLVFWVVKYLINKRFSIKP